MGLVKKPVGSSSLIGGNARKGLVNTRLQNVVVGSNLDMNELRPSRYGAFNFFKQSSDMPGGILTEELKERAMSSIGNTLETPVFDYDSDVTISNYRSVTIEDSENTSQKYQFTFSTLSWGFTIVPAAFMNNEIKMQEDFQRKFNKYLYKVGETLDSGCIAALEAAKTQVFEKLLRYTQSGNVVQVPWTKRKTFIKDSGIMLEANDHYGEIHLIGEGGTQSIVEELAESGLYNAENKQLQYSDKVLHWSNRIATGGGEFANMFAALGGSCGILMRFEREAVLGTSMEDGTEWGIETLPLLDIPVGTYFYKSRGDQKNTHGAATADLTRGVKEHYGFSFDVCYVTPYNSDPANIANPIMKFALADEV